MITRFLLLLATGLASVQGAGFQVPRYRMTPGTKLWYSGETETTDPRGVSHSSRLREHWVLSDSGGVFRVLLRVVDQGYKEERPKNQGGSQPQRNKYPMLKRAGKGS